MTLHNNKYLTNQYKINVYFFKKQIFANQHIMCEKHSIYNAILITVNSNFWGDISNINFFILQRTLHAKATGL